MPESPLILKNNRPYRLPGCVLPMAQQFGDVPPTSAKGDMPCRRWNHGPQLLAQLAYPSGYGDGLLIHCALHAQVRILLSTVNCNFRPSGFEMQVPSIMFRSVP